jgi:16S rRNA (cytidine1402-2'-O)-methyltransferase
MSDPDSVGTLWIIATPIGTLDDLGARAGEVLESVDVILAEDTRRTRKLLSHIGVTSRGRLRSLHEHNEKDRLSWIVQQLARGSDLALVSDAGTPALSDPGFLVVRAAREAGAPVRSVPGPSSFVAALAASGQPPLPSVLAGFLPAKAGPRRRSIAELARWSGTTVVLLSPHRLRLELEDLADGFGGEREATLLAEISKRHERAVSGSLEELSQSPEGAAPRGEYVVVIGPQGSTSVAPQVQPSDAAKAYQREIALGRDRRSALKAASMRLGLSRKELYAKLLEAEKDELSRDPE